MQHGDSFILVAVLGLQAQRNLFVAPTTGQWIGGYVPAALRAFPFALASTTDGRKALTLDMDSDFIGESADGEALLTDGEPTAALQAVLNFLTQLDNNRAVTQSLCALLASHDLIQPWSIKAVTDDGDKQITGLFKIDAAKLNQLDAPALHALQQSGALQMAYLQLASMEHLSMLGQLARIHAQYQQDQSQPTLPIDSKGNLDLDFLHQDGTLSFAN